MSISYDPFQDLEYRCSKAREVSTYIPIAREINRMDEAICQLNQLLSYYSPKRPFISLDDVDSTTETVREYEEGCRAAYEKALSSLHDGDRALIEKVMSLADHLTDADTTSEPVAITLIVGKGGDLSITAPDYEEERAVDILVDSLFKHRRELSVKRRLQQGSPSS
ncbi:hypothetical protein V5S96_10165 [Corynebacterium mastitidis]|uniref:Uncharacterized protein n=1 Tax=Corynebacterium mastitidis TaxID=161890 RepID=A0ABU8P297_9CORY